MAVLELRRKVRPAWTYRVQGIIWRLVFADPELIVGETRDLDKKLASFFCLNHRDGSTLWEGVTFEEKWWIGTEAIHRDRVLLHGFATPDMPVHKGVTAVDVFTGKVVWSNQDVAFYDAVNDSVIVSKGALDGRSLLELDGRTGRLLSTWGEDMDIPDKPTPQAGTGVLMFPAPLTMISEHGAILAGKNIPQDDIVGDVEAIENGDLLLVGFHQRSHAETGSETSITDSLRIIDLNKNEIVYSEMLNTGASRIVPDMFFTREDMLYYVKERTTLVAVNLDELRR